MPAAVASTHSATSMPSGTNEPSSTRSAAATSAVSRAQVVERIVEPVDPGRAGGRGARRTTACRAPGTGRRGHARASAPHERAEVGGVPVPPRRRDRKAEDDDLHRAAPASSSSTCSARCCVGVVAQHALQRGGADRAGPCTVELLDSAATSGAVARDEDLRSGSRNCSMPSQASRDQAGAGARRLEHARRRRPAVGGHAVAGDVEHRERRCS